MKSKEIAKILGVSESTVSLARNNRPGVSEDTKQRVMALINQLPREDADSRASRFLSHIFVYRQNKSEHMANQPSPIFHTIMDTLNKQAAVMGYAVNYDFLYPEQQSPEEMVRACEAKGCAGIFINDYLGSEPNYGLKKRPRVPIVAFDQCIEKQGIDCVNIDNRGAAGAVAEQLLLRGHKKILYFESRESCHNLRERHNGFRETLWDGGISNTDDVFAIFDNNAQAADVAANFIRDRAPTAIVAEDTGMLSTLMNAAALLRLMPGRDISIACCDAVYGGLRHGIDIMNIDYNHAEQMEYAMTIMNARIEGMKGCSLKLTVSARLNKGNSVRNIRK